MPNMSRQNTPNPNTDTNTDPASPSANPKTSRQNTPNSNPNPNAASPPLTARVSPSANPNPPESQRREEASNTSEGQEEDNGKKVENAKEQIEPFDWEDLEERFWERMEECRRVEEGVMGEWGECVEVCLSSLLLF